MSRRSAPRLWLGILLAVGVIVLVFTLLPGDGRETVRVPLAALVQDARDGLIERIEVDGRDVEYKRIGDERTFSLRLEEGDTVRRVLQDAGIDPADFPPIEAKEPSFLARIPSLIFTFLPLIFIGAILFFFLRQARGAVTARTNDIDPVCGRRATPDESAGSSTFQNVTYFFCSHACKNLFDEDPVRYLLKR